MEDTELYDALPELQEIVSRWVCRLLMCSIGHCHYAIDRHVCGLYSSCLHDRGLNHAGSRGSLRQINYMETPLLLYESYANVSSQICHFLAVRS